MTHNLDVLVNKNGKPIFGTTGNIVAAHKEIDRVEDGLVYFKNETITTPDLRHLMKEPVNNGIMAIDIFQDVLYITISKDLYEEAALLKEKGDSKVCSKIDLIGSWGINIESVSNYKRFEIYAEYEMLADGEKLYGKEK